MSQARLPRTEPSTELITAHKGNNCDAHAALQTRDFSALPKHRVKWTPLPPGGESAKAGLVGRSFAEGQVRHVLQALIHACLEAQKASALSDTLIN